MKGLRSYSGIPLVHVVAEGTDGSPLLSAHCMQTWLNGKLVLKRAIQ